MCTYVCCHDKKDVDRSTHVKGERPKKHHATTACTSMKICIHVLEYYVYVCVYKPWKQGISEHSASGGDFAQQASYEQYPSQCEAPFDTTSWADLLVSRTYVGKQKRYNIVK